MNHFPSSDLISAYVDDRLSPEERAEVDTLLQSSDEARAELESYRQLRATLQALPAEAAPSDLLTRIMAQAEQESLHGKPAVAVPSTGAKGNFWKRWTIPSVSVAASVALLMLIMFQLQSPRAASNRPAQPELASLVSNSDTDRVDPTTEMTGATFADSETALSSGKLSEIERELVLSDGVQFVPQDQANDTLNMFSTYEIGRAEIGDVIEALQVHDDRVIVVQLRVIDHQRVLDGMHVLLSKVNVPRETPETNSYGVRSNDLLAIYIEAGRGELASLLSELQENSDVEQMLVSTSIRSDTLNQYVSEQGYNELFARKSFEKQPGSSSGRRATPPQAATEESIVTGQPVAEASGRGRPVNERSFKDENSKKDLSLGVEAKRNLGAFGGSLTKSELPPPPPPLPQEYKRPDSIARSKPAPAKTAPPEAPTPTLDAQSFESISQRGQRYAQIRLPEYVGKQLIKQPESAGQLAISNGTANNRDRAKILRKQQREFLSPSAAEGADFEPGAVEPAKPKPREAAEADAKDKLLFEEQRIFKRPVRVLIVLTDDPARPAEAAQPRPPEAKQKAKD